MSVSPGRGRIPPDLTLAFVLLVTMVAASLAFTRQQASDVAVMARRMLIQREINEVMSAARDGESGQRGFLLTGDESYLAPYRDAGQRAQSALARLDAIDDPIAHLLAKRLHPLVDVKFAEMRRTLQLDSGGRRKAALAAVQTGLGQRTMAELRNEVMAARGQLRGLINQLQERERLTSQWLTVGLLAGLAAIIVVALGGLRVHRRQLDELAEARDAAELAYREVLAETEARTEAEGQLRQLQKMESIGQLTGGIAHDFNNMLAVVIGSLDIAQRRSDDRERVARSISNAREGAERAAALTARLLAFSRQQPLAPVALDANRLVAGMSELLHRSLGETIEVETVLAAGLWPTYADAGQIENALLNLAVNGRDAMPDGGRLTIETANAHLDDAYARANVDVTAGQYVMIGVTDTGIGMSPEVIAKAFDPFFTTKPVGKGTGLGLSQVFGFAKQSGGHVAIYSELGQGTTVKLYLPRSRVAIAEPAGRIDTAMLPSGRSDEIILVVEDERRVRHFSVDALRDLGYTAISAPSPLRALTILDEQPSIALLFTDVVMPEMDGRRLADRARIKRPELKVLFTTGYTRNAVVHNGTLDAGVAFLPKPFTVAQLAMKVRETIDGGGVNRPV
jgi:signal transduction histidine kinase/ActR/RegA family two-component response regulator